MSKTFNIYCDESTHIKNDGHPYMLLGYVSIAYPQIKLAKEHIKAIKIKHKYEGELKWTNVHDATFLMYNELIEYFFLTSMEFRVVIVDKPQIETHSDYTFNDFYFKMYYQLLHHITDLNNEYNVFFDIKDTCSHEKLYTLKKILTWDSPIRHFQFIRSHESYFVQLADILMGAINYNLRIKSGNLEGKVIAKRKLIDKIQELAEVSLDKTTPLYKKKFNLFFISLNNNHGF